MDINITKFFNDCQPEYYSASVMELGDNAGRITWENAVDRSKDSAWLLDTEEKVDSFKSFVRGFGAWTDEDINAWTHAELTALLIQFIAGDMREGGLRADMTDDEWKDCEERAQAGQYSGRICGGPLSVDGAVYFSLD